MPIYLYLFNYPICPFPRLFESNNFIFISYLYGQYSEPAPTVKTLVELSMFLSNKKGHRHLYLDNARLKLMVGKNLIINITDKYWYPFH